ncbi:uncharacterized protein [Euphorbia lathyris]|uniref:uncharacterized protein n=1 Tax=Euphorbia lathyris TaxID=212925 RepID=UPI003313625D
MFIFLCRRLASNTQPGNVPFNPLLSVRFLSSSLPSEISLNSNEEHSFRVSYLVDSCGLSPNSAKFVSKRLNFKTPEKPDYILSFLRDNGFRVSQITETLRKWPDILNYNVNKTILPKFEFLYSIGFSRENLPKFISSKPHILHRSLEHFTLQCHDVLKSVLHSEDRVIRVLQRLSSHNLWRVTKFLAVNVSVVRELGMPEPYLSKLLLQNHEVFLIEVNKFNEGVKRIVDMGFDPAKYSFAQALLVQLQTSRKRWEAKIDLFRSWGLSEDQFLLAFRKHQRFVSLSRDSIMSKMSFLVNDMGRKPEFVAMHPVVLTLSLEKRIVPRCAVIRTLFLKGLIETELIPFQFLLVSEKQFLAKFVNDHLEEVPHLLDVLLGKSDLRELGFKFNEEHSFRVSYLVDSCGLSPNSAKFVSKRLNFKTPEKPDYILSFLRDNGFRVSQITETLRKWPDILNYNVNKTILPKFEFLYSIGFSRENLPKFISSKPHILHRSLEHFTLQCHDVLKSVLHSEDRVIRVLQRLSSHNLWRVTKFLAVNVSVVRELGMPEPYLSKLLLQNHEVFLIEVNKFNEGVKRIVDMGFDPAKYSFAQALLVQLQTSRKRWEAKIDLFRSWGLSEDQFLLAFRKHQRFVSLSRDSIMSKMSFLVNDMGRKPEFVAMHPVVLTLSLEKRIVPRCAVIRTLFLKGLIETELIPFQFLLVSEKQFLAKFVNDHLEEVPHLLDVLLGKSDLRELGFKFNDKEKA